MNISPPFRSARPVREIKRWRRPAPAYSALTKGGGSPGMSGNPSCDGPRASTSPMSRYVYVNLSASASRPPMKNVNPRVAQPGGSVHSASGRRRGYACRLRAGEDDHVRFSEGCSGGHGPGTVAGGDGSGRLDHAQHGSGSVPAAGGNPLASGFCDVYTGGLTWKRRRNQPGFYNLVWGSGIDCSGPHSMYGTAAVLPQTKNPAISGAFFKADEGTRTLDLLHGKQTL